MSDIANHSLPKAARRHAASSQKVPAFARYEGTSAWRKDRNRAREYARFRAMTKQVDQGPATPGS